LKENRPAKGFFLGMARKKGNEKNIEGGTSRFCREPWRGNTDTLEPHFQPKRNLGANPSCGKKKKKEQLKGRKKERAQRAKQEKKSKCCKNQGRAS